MMKTNSFRFGIGKLKMMEPLSDDPKPINCAGDLLSYVPMFAQTLRLALDIRCFGTREGGLGE